MCVYIYKHHSVVLTPSPLEEEYSTDEKEI